MTDLAWQTAPRPSLWAKIDRGLLTSHHRGVVLIGPSGVGKTALARAVASRHRRQDPQAVVHWVAATGSASHIPFGAFSDLLEVAPREQSAALLRAARLKLCRDVEERRLLIVIDDAHHLDTLSATLVHQLVFHTKIRLVLTVRDDLRAPEAITALWKDDILACIEVDTLTAAETTVLVESVLGGPLETSSADRLYAASGGNPLFLRHLVQQAIASDALRCSQGVWQLRGETKLSSQLVALINDRLELLPPPTRQVLSYLAIDEPLSVEDLTELTGAVALEQAEACGAVTIIASGAGSVVLPSHPLYTECVRAEMGHLTRRRLCTALVAHIAARGPDHISDRLRLAALSLETDTPLVPEELIAAAWDAMRMGDLALSERLARGAVSAKDSLSARLPLAHSLAWQGRGAEADEVLTAVDERTLTERDLVTWTLPKTANQFWMRRQPAQARQLLADVRGRVTDPGGCDLLDALEATFALNVGEPRRALDAASAVLVSSTASDLAVAWAASTATLATARMGLIDRVAGFARRAIQTAQPGLLPFWVGMGQITASLLDCDPVAAEAVARHYLDFAGVQQPARAICDILLADVLMARGNVVDASLLLFQSAAVLADTGYTWGPLSLMQLTHTLGQQGDHRQAARELLRAEAAHDMRSGMYAPELELARAWTLAAARDMPGAVAAARRSAAVAEDTGQLGIAMQAAHNAVRLGDTEAAAWARRIGDQVGGTLARLVVDHARCLADGDAAGLDEVAESFASRQRLLAAADAAAQAVVLHAAAGRHTAEVNARNRAAQWAAECGSPRTPALERALTPLPLTGSERRIAGLVAEGFSNKAIAERLSVSVRTVEGHIYRACTKLGLADRAALASAITKW